jgi:hypothetical protein
MERGYIYSVLIAAGGGGKAKLYLNVLEPQAEVLQRSTTTAVVNHDPERTKPQSGSIGEKTKGKLIIISLGQDTPAMALLSERTGESYDANYLHDLPILQLLSLYWGLVKIITGGLCAYC